MICITDSLFFVKPWNAYVWTDHTCLLKMQLCYNRCEYFIYFFFFKQHVSVTLFQHEINQKENLSSEHFMNRSLWRTQTWVKLSFSESKNKGLTDWNVYVICKYLFLRSMYDKYVCLGLDGVVC